MSLVEQQIQKARALVLAGSAGEAETLLRKQLQRSPGEPLLIAELAMLLARLNKREQALFFAQQAGESGNMAALESAGHALTSLGESERAIAMFRRAIAKYPSQAAAHNGLGVRYIQLRRFEEAAEAFGRAHELAPADPYIAANVALAYSETWRLEEALEILRKARALAPDAAAVQHQMPYLGNYSDRMSAEELFAEHRRFAALTTRRAPAVADPAIAEPADAERTLRVGLMSADFREHSVSRFLEPILREHDGAAVRYTLYPLVAQQDEMTAQFRGWAEEWSDAAMQPEARAAAAIRREKIDILIDLAGLTRGMRAHLLIARAAPVQVTYLGYPNTTAMPNVDVRLVDSITDPAGAESLATERLVRLDPCFLCYTPPPVARDIAARGAADESPVTFGSFNYLTKVTPTTLELWAAILKRVPGSRLVLKAEALRFPGVRERVTRALAERGIEAWRVELIPYVESLADHYRLYHRIDVALDPFPYHGTTTTCEALYMGVPVIALAGDRHASRVGVSLLTAGGVPELVAENPGEYVGKAVELSGSISRRNGYHAELRARLMASPLGDGAAFARRFEGMLREIWRDRVSRR